MSREVRQKALQPFFTTKAEHDGTGLGLSIVYGFAAAAGGDMRLSSTEGDGTLVQLILPRGAAIAADPAGEVARRLVPGGGRNILLVEDEAPLREMLAVSLTRMGYAVTEAADAPAALRLLNEGLAPDLLLTDIAMPGGMDGFELARLVRDLRPEAAILYLTGNAVLPRGARPAVTAPLLRKPVAADRLATAIRRALGSVQHPAG